MGLLSLGTPLHWDEAKQYVDHVRDHGIIQLLNIFKRFGDRKGDRLLWGDEIEYMVVKMDKKSQSAQLSLRQEQILDTLIQKEKSGEFKDADVSFHQEYGRYMLEATPNTPYTGEFSDLMKVETNMRRRRGIASRNTDPDESIVSISVFPTLGVGTFCEPYVKPEGNVSRSFFLPDSIINTHLRFPTLTANIRRRRGEKVAINVPLYKDTNTIWDKPDPTIPWDRALYKTDSDAKNGAALMNHIYMDSMGFGMGCSCVQITFQATDVAEARMLYDQLTPLAPIMLALCGASPIYRGQLSDQDARWNVVSMSVDDRTRAERGLRAESPEEILSSTTKHNSGRKILKSRYGSVSCYLDSSPVLKSHQEFYNDLDLVINKRVEGQLKESGMDDLLVQHFSHLFIRDPLVIFRELLDQDDTESTDHFENIQSTNWQTIRFKPPPSEAIGWRVEFRPMDVQITDFENSAFCVFIVLLTRVMISYKLCFYMPISKVDENMATAHSRDAALKGKFWFRTNIKSQDGTEKPKIELLTINELMNGCERFEGLLTLMRQYLGSMNVDIETLCQLESYLSLVQKRSDGRLQTCASWTRNFVLNHPSYKHDSIISSDVNYDLMAAYESISRGEGWDSLAKGMLGGCKSQST